MIVTANSSRIVAAVAGGPSWQESRGQANWRLPGAEHLGRWALAGLILSLLLHVVAYFVIGGHQIPFGLGTDSSVELRTGPIQLENVDAEQTDTPEPAPDQAVATPPTAVAPLLEDIEVFRKLPTDAEIDMRPDVKTAAYDLKIGEPVASGTPTGNTPDPVKHFDIDADLPNFGTSDRLMPTAADGQVTIDPGGIKGDENDSRKMVDDLIKKGGNGKAEHGSLQGSLEDLLGLPENVLVGKTTILPGDLLFEYNSAELRESARLGLGKLGMLIDLNRNMYCWIDGYSDLFGGDDFNLSLSQRRAAAVKDYLVKSMHFDGGRIIARGFGKQQPRVASGSVEEQAPNRRVEIKMRKTPPADVGPAASQSPPTPLHPTDPSPPKAVLVKPARALPVEESPPQPQPPARAKPVPEAPPRARTVEDPPPRATVPRAEHVEE